MKLIDPIIATVYRPARARRAGDMNISGESKAACVTLNAPHSAYF